jgi:hypothetical protein
MLRRLLSVGAVASAVIAGALVVAPVAEAKPKEPTLTCHTEYHIAFDDDGSVLWEGNLTTCTWTYPSGTIIERTRDDATGEVKDICVGKKGRIGMDCQGGM